VITRELAEELRRIGPRWSPTSGDRFVIPDRDLDDEVFVISEMTIEAADVPGGQIIRFNGTTEWALDSIAAELALWLPREDQLRAMLGRRFARLVALPDGFVVVLDDGSRHVDVEAERAYARAAIAVLSDPARV
jgi:hypothetical protein